MTKKLSDVTTVRLHDSDSMTEASNSKLMAIIKYLRQEKDTMASRLKVTQAETARLQNQLDHQQRLVTEGETDLKVIKEKVSTLLSEKIEAEADAVKWKKRSEELVEKSLKINPKELARLQEVEINLTKSVSQLEAEKMDLEVKVNSHTKEVEAIKRQLASSLQEKSKAATESQEKMKEIATVNRENVLLKNSQTNLQKESLTLKKKLEDLSVSHSVEMAKLKKSLVDKDAALKKLRENKGKLKTIGKALLSETEKLKKEKKELAKINAEKETRAEVALSNAKDRITRVEKENKELCWSLETLSSCGVGSQDEDELRKVLSSQLFSVRQDREKMEEERNKAVQEKEKMLEQVENLQQELVATQHQLALAGDETFQPTLKRARDSTAAEMVSSFSDEEEYREDLDCSGQKKPKPENFSLG